MIGRVTTADPRHDDPPPDDTGLRDMAHGVLDSNRYLVLCIPRPGHRERDGRAGVGGGARPFAPDELSGDAGLRLYRATVETAQVHVRGSHPVWGSGIDRRVTVRLG